MPGAPGRDRPPLKTTCRPKTPCGCGDEYLVRYREYEPAGCWCTCCHVRWYLGARESDYQAPVIHREDCLLSGRRPPDTFDYDLYDEST